MYLSKRDIKLKKFIKGVILKNTPFIQKYFYEGKIFFMGGVIRNFYENKKIEEINDLDIFCKDEKFFNEIEKIFLEKKFNKYNFDKNISQFKKNNIKVDLIYKFSDLEKNLNWSDFTISKILFYKGILFYHKNFFQDLLEKKLIYTGSETPSLSKQRFLKYQEYGFQDKDGAKNKIIDDIILKEN